MNYLTDINLNKNELQNAVIQPLAVAPSSAKQGQIYFNSSDKMIYQYDGSTWKPVGVVYQQNGTTGAVIVGLDTTGTVTTKNVIELTLTGYTPVSGGYVAANMTIEQAVAALDEAVKNAVAGGGEINQNAWSKVTVKQQSTATTAVTGATVDTTLSSDAKVDTFNIASGNKWIDINGSGKTVTIGHSLSSVTAGSAGAADTVPVMTVDAGGHVTSMDTAKITPAAIGADIAGAAAAVLGTTGDASTTATVYGVRKLASEAKDAAATAQTIAESKVASVGATANKGIEISGTSTAPTVGIKLDSTAGNAATLSANGLMVTIPEVVVPEYNLIKDDVSGDYAAIYHLTKDGANIGAAINIPKDLFVKEGKIVDNPAGQSAGKYIELTLQNQDEKIYINVADLVDAYTAGNGITISATNVVSAKVVEANGLSVGANGIVMAAASASSAGAMSSADYNKLLGIANGATNTTITLNGESTTEADFYAPTKPAESDSYILVGNETGEPTWMDSRDILIPRKAWIANPEIQAVDGVFVWEIPFEDSNVWMFPVMQIYSMQADSEGFYNIVMADMGWNENGDIRVKIQDVNNIGTLPADTYTISIVS